MDEQAVQLATDLFVELKCAELKHTIQPLFVYNDQFAGG